MNNEYLISLPKSSCVTRDFNADKLSVALKTNYFTSKLNQLKANLICMCYRVIYSPCNCTFASINFQYFSHSCQKNAH